MREAEHLHGRPGAKHITSAPMPITTKPTRPVARAEPRAAAAGSASRVANIIMPNTLASTAASPDDGVADLVQVGDGPDAHRELGEHRVHHVQPRHQHRALAEAARARTCRAFALRAPAPARRRTTSAMAKAPVRRRYGGRHDRPAPSAAPMTRLNSRPAMPGAPLTAANAVARCSPW